MSELRRRLLRRLLGPSPAERDRAMIEAAGQAFVDGFNEGVARIQRGEPFEGFSPESWAMMERSAARAFGVYGEEVKDG